MPAFRLEKHAENSRASVPFGAIHSGNRCRAVFCRKKKGVWYVLTRFVVLYASRRRCSSK